MNWLDRIIPSVGSVKKPISGGSTVPEGLWQKCPGCEANLYTPDIETNLHVCPECNHHMRVGARARLAMILDEKGTVKEFGKEIETRDHLQFRDHKKYKDRLASAARTTEESEALVTVRGEIMGIPAVVACFEFAFLGGSMGAAVGERFVNAVDVALEKGLPLVCFTTSGGARMQESMFSLLQMARTSAAIEKLKTKSNPYISVLTDPVYGGVAASLAMLGDINIAEPGALIGFTGPRVIEQTVRIKLPEGFQRSEFQLKHGAIDMIVHRKDLKAKIASLLGRLLDAPGAAC